MTITGIVVTGLFLGLFALILLGDVGDDPEGGDDYTPIRRNGEDAEL
jgi:hypothetical protein